MSDGIRAWLDLPDERLAEVAAGRFGAWLWTEDAARLIWANPVGRAVLEPGPVDPADPQRRQLVQLAPRLADKVRLERLRGFGAAPGGLMTCACSRLTLADGSRAVLVAAMDRTVPTPPLAQRLTRLVADREAPLAAFTADGALAAASRSGAAILGGINHLDALGGGDAAAAALRDGEAAFQGRTGEIVLRRLGHGAEAALVARLSADFAAPDPAAPPAPAPRPEPQSPEPQLPRPDDAPAPESEPEPEPEPEPQPEPEEEPPAAQRPLRFLWQMDASGRFAFAADPFTRLIGPLTTAAFGRLWQDINAALHLDPTDRVLRAVATRRTFSGIVVQWPVDGSDLRLPVELSALPLHDRDRRFIGYRGFGVCRDLAALDRLAARRRADILSLRPPPPAPPCPETAMTPPMPLDPPPNVLPFRTANGEETASLTPVENNTFNELARRLSERLEQPVAPPADVAQTPNVPPPDAGPSAAVLRAMLDAVTDAALTLAPDGRILSANRAALALFAADEAALLRMTIFDLLAAADHQAVHAALAGTPLPRREVRGRAGDSRMLPLALTLSRAADGTAFAVLHDLTAAQEHARERHDLQRRLTRVAADKADLAAWTGREVRHPAESIAAFAGLMIDERFGPLGNEQYGAHLRDIRAAAQRIIKTLDEWRDLARIEAGDFPLAPVPLNLNDTVEAAIAERQPEAGRARVVIRSSFAAALPPVTADPAALRQIASSLIALSIHLANAGGQAIVSTARADDGRVTLRLRDTGPGLTEEELAVAAEPFRATASTGRATLANAGINLALTKALIAANGAVFTIRSAAASGTLIEVAFARTDGGEA